MVAYCYWANKGRRNCQPLFLLHIVFLGKFQTIVLSLSFLVLPQFPPPTFLLLHACTAMFFRGRSYVFLTPQTHFSSDSRFRMYIKWMATICYTCLQWRQVSGSLQCESMWWCALRRPPLSSTLHIYSLVLMQHGPYIWSYWAWSWITRKWSSR